MWNIIELIRDEPLFGPYLIGVTVIIVFGVILIAWPNIKNLMKIFPLRKKW